MRTTVTSTSITRTTSATPATSRWRGTTCPATRTSPTRCRLRSCWSSPIPAKTTTTAASSSFGPPTATSIWARATGAPGAIPPNNAQNLNVLLGKMLRLDVDGTGAVPCGQTAPAPYAIPPSNPFVGAAGLRRDLGLRPAQPVSLLLRPVQRRSLHRGRRTEPMGGDRPPAFLERRRRELRLAPDGRTALLQPAEQLRRREPDASDPRVRPLGGLLGHRRLPIPRRGGSAAERCLCLRRLLRRADLPGHAGRRRNLVELPAPRHEPQHFELRRGRGRGDVSLRPRRRRLSDRTDAQPRADGGQPLAGLRRRGRSRLSP